MKFFEPRKSDLTGRSFQEKGVSGVHRGFSLTHDKLWYWNRDFNVFKDRFKDEGPSVKCRFLFADPALLDDCPWLTKIGMNTDTSVRLPYVGFAYADSQDAGALEAWANRFPDVQLIFGLDADGVPKEDSEYVIVKRA